MPAKKGHCILQVVKTLTQRGVDVNQHLSSGHTALTLAAAHHLTFLAQTLVNGEQLTPGRACHIQ